MFAVQSVVALRHSQLLLRDFLAPQPLRRDDGTLPDRLQLRPYHGVAEDESIQETSSLRHPRGQ
jgi:hypothetical protein